MGFTAPIPALLDVAISSRASNADMATVLARATQARSDLWDRIDALAAALADGEISVARIQALDRLVNDYTATLATFLKSGTTGMTIVARDAEADVLLTNGAANNTFGSWVELIPGPDAQAVPAHALVGVICRPTSLASFYNVQIGVGALGAEAAIAAVKVRWETAAGALPYFPVWPPVQLAANARVSARSKGIGAQAVAVAVAAIPRPF